MKGCGTYPQATVSPDRPVALSFLQNESDSGKPRFSALVGANVCMWSPLFPAKSSLHMARGRL
jgi:hypothetical protein